MNQRHAQSNWGHDTMLHLHAPAKLTTPSKTIRWTNNRYYELAESS